MSKTNRSYINNQAIQVLNKVEYDTDGNPIGLMEDPNDPLSANFGTDRLPRRGGCYKWDSSNYLKVTTTNGNIESVSALNNLGNIVTLTATYVTDSYQIRGISGEYAWNIKCWKPGSSPSTSEKKSLTLDGSGGIAKLFSWYKADENYGNIAYDSLG